MTDPRISVVILAGGRSSRFGRDKMAEPLDGRPLLSHAIEAVRPLAGEILVVAAPDATPALTDAVTLVHDPVAFEGPLAGARAGIDAASGSIVIIVGGDMPDLDALVLGSMIDGLDGFDAVALEHDGGSRPLPMVVRREPALAAADALLGTGERRLRALIETLATHVVAEPAWRTLDPHGSTLRDIDTEADLR